MGVEFFKKYIIQRGNEQALQVLLLRWNFLPRFEGWSYSKFVILLHLTESGTPMVTVNPGFPSEICGAVLRCGFRKIGKPSKAAHLGHTCPCGRPTTRKENPFGADRSLLPWESQTIVPKNMYEMNAYPTTTSESCHSSWATFLGIFVLRSNALVEEKIRSVILLGFISNRFREVCLKI